MSFWRVFLLLAVLATLLFLGAPQHRAATVLITGRNAAEAAVELSTDYTFDYVWAGERLTRPAFANDSLSAESATVDLKATSAYTGTLAPIAARLGTSVKAVLNSSGLFNPSAVFTGQRQTNQTAKATPTPAPPAGKWIDVDISSQTIMAYEGNAPLKTVLMSSGIGWRLTPIGSFKVYLKVATQTMSGGYGASRYYLPGVPWILYFSGDNAIHGTYWHNNFGLPMSHGCVNVSIPDAKWFYDWGAVGTPVVVHR